MHASGRGNLREPGTFIPTTVRRYPPHLAWNQRLEPMFSNQVQSVTGDCENRRKRQLSQPYCQIVYYIITQRVAIYTLSFLRGLDAVSSLIQCW
jgi:hypothetical protein